MGWHADPRPLVIPIRDRGLLQRIEAEDHIRLLDVLLLAYVKGSVVVGRVAALLEVLEIAAEIYKLAEIRVLPLSYRILQLFVGACEPCWALQVLVVLETPQCQPLQG